MQRVGVQPSDSGMRCSSNNTNSQQQARRYAWYGHLIEAVKSLLNPSWAVQYFGKEENEVTHTLAKETLKQDHEQL